MIDALKALCRLHGVETVAASARVSAENLRQVVAGTKLGSGQPRGVGPSVQRRLEEAYPGWSNTPRLPSANYSDRHEVDESDWATLQAVKALVPEDELRGLRDRHAKVRQDLLRELKELAAKASKGATEI